MEGAIHWFPGAKFQSKASLLFNNAGPCYLWAVKHPFYSIVIGFCFGGGLGGIWNLPWIFGGGVVTL